MKIIGFLVILLMMSVIPISYAQISMGEKAEQESVVITINSVGEIHVKHVVKPSDLPVQLDLIEGVSSNLLVTNEEGLEKEMAIIGGGDGILIFPSQSETIIEYDLDNVLSQKDNVWTWDFEYLQTTAFLFPNEVDLVFVDERPVFLGEKKGIACHGCVMILEYSINEPKNIKQVNWIDKKFLVEIRTFAEIENFGFNQTAKEISFRVNDSNQFVTTTIPLELLWNPYMVFFDDEKIFKHEFNNNGTHISLNIRPETSGEVKIIGTTVVPEFPIIAPLAIGFLIILAVPLIRKFNLH